MITLTSLTSVLEKQYSSSPLCIISSNLRTIIFKEAGLVAQTLHTWLAHQTIHGAGRPSSVCEQDGGTFPVWSCLQAFLSGFHPTDFLMSVRQPDLGFWGPSSVKVFFQKLAWIFTLGNSELYLTSLAVPLSLLWILPPPLSLEKSFSHSILKSHTPNMKTWQMWYFSNGEKMAFLKKWCWNNWVSR